MAERAFNAILDTPPEKIWPCIIDKTDFKQVLKFFRLVSDPELTEQEKFYYMLNIFFSNPSEHIRDPKKAVDSVLDFIAGGRKRDRDDAESGKRTFCFNHDHGGLFAAFMQTYKIDLRSAEMHWWTFNELFQYLPESTRLMQIIELRGRKPQKGDSAESKRALRKAQASVALDDDVENTNELDKFFGAWGK